jgi:outer membrane autotransporter protein
MAGLNIEPYGRLSYVHSRFDGFQETRLSDAALNGMATSLSNTIGTVGITMNKRFMLNDSLSMDARFEAAWNRAFGDQATTRQFAFSSGLPFDITGTGISRDSVLLDARLSFWRSERFGLDVIYSGLLGNDMQSHRFSSTVKIRF